MPRSQRITFSLPPVIMRSTQSRYASVSSELPRLWMTGSGVVRSRFSSAWFFEFGSPIWMQSTPASS